MLICFPIINICSLAIKYMLFAGLKDLCMAIYLWNTLLNGQWDITVCKLMQAAIILGVQNHCCWTTAGIKCHFFNIAVLQIKNIGLIFQYIARVVGMQRGTHKMEVKRNKGTLQNYARTGIPALSNSQIFFTSGGRK